MSAFWENFLDQNLPQPGVAACVLRLPDGTIISRSAGNELRPQDLHAILNQLLSAADGVRQHFSEAYTLSWTFERAHAHLTLRPDGAALLSLCANESNAADSDGARRLIHSFQQI